MANFMAHVVDVLVIGAGQAGLCAAYELQKRGFVGYSRGPEGDGLGADRPTLGTFVVLDADEGPGGAWQHRWPSLHMATVNGIADLPGLPVGEIPMEAESRKFVPAYFAEFEHANDLPIIRPVKVHEVVNTGIRVVSAQKLAEAAHATPAVTFPSSKPNVEPERDAEGFGKIGELLEVRTSAGVWRAKFVINCTGTWNRPFMPYYPGAELFRGRHFHTRNYPGPDAFWKQNVLVVGGGISAIGHIEELWPEAKNVRWVTRTPPRWKERELHATRGLTADEGREVERKVRERVEAGLPPLPVVAATGLPLTDRVRDLREQGVLDRKPMFDRLDKTGAWWGDHHEDFDAIIWATGFRPNLAHLSPLKLKTPQGGVQMDGIHAVIDQRVYLLGYGPSASTVGARRDARVAVRELKARMQIFGK